MSNVVMCTSVLRLPLSMCHGHVAKFGSKLALATALVSLTFTSDKLVRVRASVTKMTLQTDLYPLTRIAPYSNSVTV